MLADVDVGKTIGVAAGRDVDSSSWATRIAD